MKKNKLIYQGGAKIYLQGMNALEVLPGPMNGEQICFAVGAPESAITIHDYRIASLLAAEKALTGEDIYNFASIFNQAARICIYENRAQIDIEIHESQEDRDKPVLWLGVTDDGSWAAYQTSWEKLRSLEDARVAFAALIV